MAPEIKSKRAAFPSTNALPRSPSRGLAEIGRCLRGAGTDRALFAVTFVAARTTLRLLNRTSGAALISMGALAATLQRA